MQMQEPFQRCPECHKYILPPGLIIMVHSVNGMEKFCDTQGACGRIECPGCGFYVNPLHHSQWECNMAKKVWGDARKTEPLMDEQDVLAEAEAILRETRGKG